MKTSETHKQLEVQSRNIGEKFTHLYLSSMCQEIVMNRHNIGHPNLGSKTLAKSISSSEQNYFLLFAMRYPVQGPLNKNLALNHHIIKTEKLKKILLASGFLKYANKVGIYTLQNIRNQPKHKFKMDKLLPWQIFQISSILQILHNHV